MSEEDQIASPVNAPPTATTPEAPQLTNNTDINKQLIKFFWISVWLQFLSCVISTSILLITGQIDWRLFVVFILNLSNIIIIGGGAKLIQSYMQSLYKQAAAATNK